MTTLLLTHPLCLQHAVPRGHPECPARLRAIYAALGTDDFSALKREEAPRAQDDDLHLAHSAEYIAHLQDLAEARQAVALDPDTWLSPHSYDAALHAAGAGLRAVDAVMRGEAENAFCAVRPPGHHATGERAMGFCLFNSIAIAARHALQRHGLTRVAIVDFDVHHGNGTQDIFWSDERVLYISSHQSPGYPGSGAANENGAGNILNVPLPPGSGSAAFRSAYERMIFPRLTAFAPQCLFLSAGFDAHARDPLADLNLTTADFAWLTQHLRALATEHAQGRVVSMLEGGYDLGTLADSVAAHVKALMG